MQARYLPAWKTAVPYRDPQSTTSMKDLIQATLTPRQEYRALLPPCSEGEPYRGKI